MCRASRATSGPCTAPMPVELLDREAGLAADERDEFDHRARSLRPTMQASGGDIPAQTPCARHAALHDGRALKGPRGRLQPLVRTRPLLRRLHGRASTTSPLAGAVATADLASPRAGRQLMVTGGDPMRGSYASLYCAEGALHRMGHVGDEGSRHAARERPHVRRARPRPHTAPPLRLGSVPRPRRRAGGARTRPSIPACHPVGRTRRGMCRRGVCLPPGSVARSNRTRSAKARPCDVCLNARCCRLRRTPGIRRQAGAPGKLTFAQLCFLDAAPHVLGRALRRTYRYERWAWRGSRPSVPCLSPPSRGRTPTPSSALVSRRAKGRRAAMKIRPFGTPRPVTSS